MEAVKFAQDSEEWIEGLSMPFGGPFNGRDIQGEFFSAKTDFAFDWFPEGRPVLYHHGLDDGPKISVVGRVKGYEVKPDIGVWAKCQLDKSNEYFGAIKDLVSQGKLYFSSGSLRHLTQTSKSGEILRWPWIEQSLTPTPSNLLAEVNDVEQHYKAASIKADLSALKAELSTESRANLEGSDFAYIDSEGGKHLPIHDAAHVRNALARFDQTTFESDSAKEKARKKLDAAARKFKIGDYADGAESKKSAAVKTMEGSYEDMIDDLGNLVNPYSPFGGCDCYNYICATYPDYCIVKRCDRGECTHWRVEYTLGPDGEPVLGRATEVEETFVPVQEPESETESLITQAEKATRLVALITQRAEALRDRRIKSGREVSSANHGHMRALHARMSAAHAEMGKHVADMAGFLDRTDPNKRAEAEAEAKSMLRRRDVELQLLRMFAATLPQPTGGTTTC